MNALKLKTECVEHVCIKLLNVMVNIILTVTIIIIRGNMIFHFLDTNSLLLLPYVLQDVSTFYSGNY